MKRLFVALLLIFVFIFASCSKPQVSDIQPGAPRTEEKEISQTFRFKQPTWQRTPEKPPPKRLNLIVADCDNFAEPGNPLLPFKGIEMEIPDGYDFVSLSSKSLKSEILKEYNVISCGQVPTNEYIIKEWKETEPEPKIYNSRSDYPENLLFGTIKQTRREKRLVMAGLIPLRINFANKQVTYYPEIQVTMKIKKASPPDTLSTNSLQAGSWKMVIIAPNILIGNPTGGHNNWADYAVWKTTFLNFPTRTYSVEAINTDPSYATLTHLSAKIKQFIRDAKNTWGIEYVLLGGDSDTIPSFKINSHVNTTYSSMPSDTYYACLDNQNWNWVSNTDNTTQNDYTSTMDLAADIYVGRVSLRTLPDLKNFFDKQIIIEDEYTNNDFYKTALLTSGLIFPAPNTTWGEWTCEDLLINSQTAASFLQPSSKIKLYQNTSINSSGLGTIVPLNPPNSTGSTIINQINASKPDVIIPFFHGNESVYGSYNTNGSQLVTLNINTLGTLTTQRPFLINTEACITNHFDGSIEPCLSERFIREKYGAFAYIGGANSGWGYPGLSYVQACESYVFQRKFIELFFPSSLNRSLGEAFHLSKEYFISNMQGSNVYRWIYHSLNLLGDPSTGEVSSAKLWMRDTPNDYGFEPNPTNDLMYISDDIWLRQNDDGLLNQWTENAEYKISSPNYVYVKVRNANVPGNAKLKLYWAKASPALSWEDPWTGHVYIPSSTTKKMGNLIGEVPISSALLYNAHDRIIKFPWNVPDPADYIQFGSDQNHFCLLARIETDPDNPPYGMTYPEVLGDLWGNVKNNNKIVWKNISVFDNVIGNIATVGTLVANYKREEEITRILFAVPKSEKFPLFKYGDLIITLSDPLYKRWQEAGSKSEGVRITGKEFKVTSPNVWLGDIRLKPNEIFGLQVRYSLKSKPDMKNLEGFAFNFDVQQMAYVKDKWVLRGGCRYQYYPLRRPKKQPK